MMRHGNRVNFDLAGLRIVNHRVAAWILFAFFILGRVTLLGAKVNLAGQFAHVVARVNL